MKFRVILTFTTLSILLLVGCTQRTYIMDFDSNSGTTNPRFYQPTPLQERDQTPEKVTRPNETEAHQMSIDQSDAEVSVDGSSESESYSESFATSTIDFTKSEQQHVKFTSYNPFAELSTDSFEIDLNTLHSEFSYPINGRFSSPYGRRGRGIHTGIDIVAPAKTPIYASFSGVVRLSKPYSGYGNTIVVRHNNGMETVYTHNSKNLVKVGQYVGSGERIALCGRTGNATTDHLHFEVRINGQTIDPELIVDVNNKTLQQGVLIVSNSSSGTVTARRLAGGNPSAVVSRDNVDIAPPLTPNDKQQDATTQPAKTQSTATQSAKTQPTTTQPAKTQSSATSSKGIRIDGKLYSAPEPQASSAKSEKLWHTVVGGDTLSEIADKYSITLSALCELNEINRRSVIRVGGKLRVR